MSSQPCDVRSFEGDHHFSFRPPDLGTGVV
jgi:hypothetical protein